MVNDVPRDHPLHMGRYQTRMRDLPLLPIHEALRLHCHINFKQCFIATITPDNSIQTFVSPGQRLEEDVRNQFFDERRFRAVMERVETGADPMLQSSPSGRRNSARATPATSARSSGSQGPARTTRRRGVKKDQEAAVTQLRSFRVSDSDKIWDFYKECFKAASQVVCKSLAKAWIKTFEPKKQTNHPYTGEDATAPSWWPRPWGLSSSERVRHKEPDHLGKEERVHLLAAMLRLVVEPVETQHPQIRRMELNVETLTEVMLDSLVRDFAAKPEAEKCLRDMLRIARLEERYKAGELDASARLHIPEEYQDADIEEDLLIKEENENNGSQANPIAAATALVTSQTPNQGPSSAALGPPAQMAMRSQFGQPAMPDIHPHAHHHSHHQPQHQHHPSLSPNNGAMDLEMVQSPHDASRRTSMFTDYASAGASPMQYQTQWQPGSTTATTSPMYAYNTAPGGTPQPSYNVHATGHMGQGQAFMSTGFEGHPRQAYDQTPSALFRGNDLGQTQGTHAEGYTYLSPESRGTRGSPVIDPIHRSHLG
jgi:hypothetical protein